MPPAPLRALRADLFWIAPIDALTGGNALKQRQADLRRTRPRPQDQFYVLEQSRLLSVARMVEGEIFRRERRNIDRVDTTDDDRPKPSRHVAGTRHATGKAARNSKRYIVGRGIEG